MGYIAVFLGVLCGISIFIIGKLLFFSTQKDKTEQLMGWIILIFGFGNICTLFLWISGLWTDKEVSSIVLENSHRLSVLSLTVGFFIFYYLLRSRYHFHSDRLHTSIWFLFTLHILLCFFPVNQWEQADAEYLWGICRNIPLFLLGFLIFAIAVFYICKKRDGKILLYGAAVIFYSICCSSLHIFSLKWGVAGALFAYGWMVYHFARCQRRAGLKKFLFPRKCPDK